MGNYIRQSWLVVVLALAFGASLAGVNATLKGIIESNQKNEIDGQVPLLVGGADAAGTRIDEELSALAGMKVRRACDADGKQLGWVLRASGMGFADKIEALVALNLDVTKITGVYILDQKETPGLGSKIAGPWNEQYRNRPTASPLVVVKHKARTPEQIDAISGATISSQVLTDIVNRSIETFRAALAAQKAKEK